MGDDWAATTWGGGSMFTLANKVVVLRFIAWLVDYFYGPGFLI